jgi:hypothetical protein
VFESQYRLPALADIGTIAAKFETSSVSKALSSFVEDTSVLQRAMEQMATPWLHVQEAMRQRDNLIEMSVSGYSADDLAEAALRSVLFGERHPLADQHLGFMTEMRDPLALLRTARIADEVTRPLAELLIADEMIGSGRAARLR